MTFLWLLLTAHCSCLTTAKKLAVFGMIHHLSIDWLLRWWIHCVCMCECVQSAEILWSVWRVMSSVWHTRKYTDYAVGAGLNHQAELESYLSWFDVLGFRLRSPRCWWLNLSHCAQMSLSLANTSSHTHTHWYTTPPTLSSAHDHTTTASKPHIHRPSLNSFYHCSSFIC